MAFIAGGSYLNHLGHLRDLDSDIADGDCDDNVKKCLEEANEVYRDMLKGRNKDDYDDKERKEAKQYIVSIRKQARLRMRKSSAKQPMKSCAGQKPPCADKKCKPVSASKRAQAHCRAVKKATKQTKRKLPSALKLWRQAAVAEGYFTEGAPFKPLPKKGTAAYKKIYARYMQLKQ